jgi:hypothetical protein
MRRLLEHRLRISLGLAAGLLLSCAVALPAWSVAASPKKGKTYSGEIRRTAGGTITLPISFEVSKNGRKVHDFSLPSSYPVYCEGGGFGEAEDATAKISKKGTFNAKLPLYFAPSHEHQGFVKISGKFGKKGHESGKVVTDFTKSKSCNGTSNYSTKAQR